MLTQIEETIPLLTKKEYIALELTKALIGSTNKVDLSLKEITQYSCIAAEILITSCK